VDFKETLTPNQQKVYEIVKDYLTKNPFFTINDLYRICKKQTKIPGTEIHSILTGFVYKNIIVDGSKLTKDTVLKSPIRREIYTFISKNPALNFTQILKQFNLGSYAARWHLEMLRKFGFIRQKKIKIYNVYFSTDFPANKETIIYSLRNRNALKIYLCLQYAPLNSNNIAQILNLNYSTIQYHIKDLLENELIIVYENNKFTANPDFTDFIKQYYDLTMSQELMQICDDFSAEKEKVIGQINLVFQTRIENKLETLADQLKSLQDNMFQQERLIQIIENFEHRLLVIETQMARFSEFFIKLKGKLKQTLQKSKSQ